MSVSISASPRPLWSNTALWPEVGWPAPPAPPELFAQLAAVLQLPWLPATQYFVVGNNHQLLLVESVPLLSTIWIPKWASESLTLTFWTTWVAPVLRTRIHWELSTALRRPSWVPLIGPK